MQKKDDMWHSALQWCFVVPTIYIYIYIYRRYKSTMVPLRVDQSKHGMAVEFVSWDGKIKNLPVCKSQPNSFIWENKIHVPNHQPNKERCPGGQSHGRASGETCLILCGLAMHIDFTSVHSLKKKRLVP